MGAAANRLPASVSLLASLALACCPPAVPWRSLGTFHGEWAVPIAIDSSGVAWSWQAGADPSNCTGPQPPLPGHCWPSVHEVKSQPPAPGTQWALVAAGDSWDCGVQTDGAALCWVSAARDPPAFAPPISVASSEGWASVSLSDIEACGAKKGSVGGIWCWEEEGFDPGEAGHLRPPELVAGTNGTSWSSLSVGTYVSCAIAGNGSLWCWGEVG